MSKPYAGQLKMGYTPKRVLVLLLLGAVCASATNNDDDDCDDNEVVAIPNVKRGNPVPVQVPYLAKVPVAIQYVAADYSGPYDPFDSDGSSAASHRALKSKAKKSIQAVKSLIPPDLDEFIKKEVTKVAVKEGKRFVLSHPKEASDVFSIFRRAKSLLKRAQKILDKKNENDD